MTRSYRWIPPGLRIPAPCCGQVLSPYSLPRHLLAAHPSLGVRDRSMLWGRMVTIVRQLVALEAL